MFKIKSIVVEQPRSPDGGTIQGNPMTLCDSHPADLIRREFLQVGFCGFLGFGLAGLLAGRALAEGVAAARPSGATAGTRMRARSMILVFLTGGLSHLDSLDMKSDAPEGIRGEFRPIATRVPGMQVCEHLPELAARAEKLAIVRLLRGGTPRRPGKPGLARRDTRRGDRRVRPDSADRGEHRE